MLSYQHIYHAGNAADVQKHLWLIRVLIALKRQEKPVLWIDTHAGRGLYDLNAPEAQKLGEYREGFLKFRDQDRGSRTPEEIKVYLKIVEDLNKKSKGFYPGSSLIAAKILDLKDSLHLYELHKGEVEFLKKSMKPFTFAKVYKADGYSALASLPARTHDLGGVLIDPSYEVKTEYAYVLDCVQKANKIWPTGIFLIWYPILKAGNHAPMLDGFKTMQQNGTRLIIEEQMFRPSSQEGKGLAGTGMVIINPPF